VTLSLWSLLGFAVWTLLVVLLGIGPPRFRAIIVDKARPNSFTPGVPHGSDRYQRTMRAHVNCVENLPVFAALVLIGAVLEIESTLFQTVALIVLPARVLQSAAHIASARNRAVLVRFAFFSLQFGCFFLLALLLALHGLER
jgi:uncharacterized MAPEG superfamily protein